MDPQFSHHSILKFVKITPNACTPTRNTPQSIGLDLYSAYTYNVPAKGRCLVKTDLQVKIPPGCYGRIAPTSRLAFEHFIDIGAGVIDPDYRGNVGVLVFNFGKQTHHIERGSKVAQLILEQAMIPIAQEVTRLDLTERGQRGFGFKPPHYSMKM